MGQSAENVVRFPDAQAWGGCRIGTDSHSGEAVYLSDQARQQGLIDLIGVAGSGKTTTLHHLIQADLTAGRGLALVEPHGDLTRAVIATMPEKRVADVVLLNLMDCGEAPFSLNIFERPNPYTPVEVAKTASQVFHIFERVWGLSSATPNLGMVLRNVTRTLIENRATFSEIPLLLQDEAIRERMVKRVTSPHTRAFWEAYERRSARDKLDLVGSCLNRVDAYLQDEMIANIVSQERSTVGFRRIMDEGKVLLVLLSPQLEEVSRLIGSMVVAGILRAAFSRADTPEDQRRQFSLYIDEFQHFVTDDTAVLIHEARKWRLSPICLAHQTLAQLTEANRAAVTAASTRIVFRVAPEDARELAGAFDTTPPTHGEVIGYEPIRERAANPLEFLLRHSHPSEIVAHFTEYFLVPLDTLHKKLIGHAHPFNFGGVWLNPAYVVEAEKLVNRAFAQTMRTGRADLPIDPLALYVLGYADSVTREVLLPHLKISSWNAPGEFLEMNESAWVYGRGDFLSDEQAVARLLQRHPDRWVRVELFKPKRLLTPGRSFLRMLRLLRQTMEILAKEPILVDTGQYQPKYQQRTYADMVGERANELSSMLPNYHARVRLPSGEEHVVKTNPAPQGLSGDLLTARIQRIKRQMRFLGYVREARAVEEEVRKRHERLRGSAGADDPPPTHD